MVLVDIIILIILVLGAIGGFKSGVIKKTTDFVGTLIIVVLAFYLKNYLSVIMYENLPFYNFGGFINEIEVINILFYEVLAFVIVFALLFLILRVLLMITGLIEKILKATIILSIPSKILGIFVGIIQMYVYVFIALIFVSLPVFNISYIKESKLANFMLDNTPILSSMSEDIIETYRNIYGVLDNKENKTREEVNTEILMVLFDKEVITKESARKLVEKNKLHLSDNTILE